MPGGTYALPMWPREGMLSFALEEYFDVQEALDELEARREKLRNMILAELRGGFATRLAHPRGHVRVDRYASFVVKSPSRIVPLLQDLAWLDECVTLKGRTLHKMARVDRDTLAAVRAIATEREHEVLVITPKREPKGTRDAEPDDLGS